ncbi:MAG: hypothetical protein HND52_04550 [Ignavibacteriae bacterium]|nr:hypothetical protein [Ignavibacteriota bacterium]NOG97228.1 hypothetical protein [Ignavibacteriota bacterium]
MIKEILAVFRSDSMMDRAYNRSYDMIYLTQEMFKTAKDVLRYSEHSNTNIDVNDQDIEVNKYQREVRKDVLKHLALEGTDNLSSGLVLVTLVIDLERIGDYTKNIVEIAENHPEKLFAGKFEQEVVKIEKAIEINFQKTIECFKNADEEAAGYLVKEYKWISRTIDEILMSLVRGEEKTLATGCTVALALYIRALKRINSHLRNIASSVVNPFHRIGYKPKKNKDK